MANVVAELDRHIEKREKEVRQWFLAIFIVPLIALAASVIVVVVLVMLRVPTDLFREVGRTIVTGGLTVPLVGWYLQKRDLTELKALRAKANDAPGVETPTPAITAEAAVTSHS